MDEFVSKFKALQKGAAVRDQVSAVYKSVKDFAKSPEFETRCCWVPGSAPLRGGELSNFPKCRCAAGKNSR